MLILILFLFFFFICVIFFSERLRFSLLFYCVCVFCWELFAEPNAILNRVLYDFSIAFDWIKRLKIRKETHSSDRIIKSALNVPDLKLYRTISFIQWVKKDDCFFPIALILTVKVIRRERKRHTHRNDEKQKQEQKLSILQLFLYCVKLKLLHVAWNGIRCSVAKPVAL